LKPAIKKISTLLFILLGFAPLLFIIFTGIRQQAIRHSMKHRLESKMLHTVTLAEQNVQWIKEGKEILINGKMFDVKKFEQIDNGKIIFTGLYDEEETLLVNQVKKNQQNDNNTGGRLLAQFFQLLQITYDNTSIETFTFSFSSNNYFPGNEHRPTSQLITILTPPPQV
jgi:hypothetical protein